MPLDEPVASLHAAAVKRVRSRGGHTVLACMTAHLTIPTSPTLWKTGAAATAWALGWIVFNIQILSHSETCTDICLKSNKMRAGLWVQRVTAPVEGAPSGYGSTDCSDVRRGMYQDAPKGSVQPARVNGAGSQPLGREPERIRERSLRNSSRTLSVMLHSSGGKPMAAHSL